MFRYKTWIGTDPSVGVMRMRDDSKVWKKNYILLLIWSMLTLWAVFFRLPLFQYYVLLAHISVPAMREITGLFDAGAVIAGSSAGTACQSSAVMIRGQFQNNILLVFTFSIVYDK